MIDGMTLLIYDEARALTLGIVVVRNQIASFLNAVRPLAPERGKDFGHLIVMIR